MTILSIIARVQCDDCGNPFSVNIDPAMKCETAFGAAEEAMTGGEGSYYDGIMRCDPCTSTHIKEWIAEHPNAASEIHPIEDGWRVVTYGGETVNVPSDHPLGKPDFDADMAAYVANAEMEAFYAKGGAK